MFGLKACRQRQFGRVADNNVVSSRSLHQWQLGAEQSALSTPRPALCSASQPPTRTDLATAHCQLGEWFTASHPSPLQCQRSAGSWPNSWFPLFLQHIFAWSYCRYYPDVSTEFPLPAIISFSLAFLRCLGNRIESHMIETPLRDQISYIASGCTGLVKQAQKCQKHHSYIYRIHYYYANFTSIPLVFVRVIYFLSISFIRRRTSCILILFYSF